MAWKLRSRARMLMRGLRYARLLPYLSIDGWLTVNEAIELYELARSVPDREPVVVEIGSWQGKSTVVLGKGLKDKEGAALCCVDPFNAAGDPSSEEDYRQRRNETGPVLRERFSDNLARNGVGGLVEVLQGYSHDVVKGFERPIDLLFIDGDHDYPSVLADFRDWTPMVVEGGLICMHDVGNPSHCGPQQVVDEELRQGHVVDVDDGGELALVAELADQPHDLARGLGVQRGGGLVHQQKPRVLDQGPGNADALTLAAGKSIGTFIDHGVETDTL